MCTIIVAWQWRKDAPLVLAANRDESLTRPSDPPALLREKPPLWGGRDRLAGGTWLAVDPRGRVCAVTNRHPGGRAPERDPSRGSRGDIPTLVLSASANDRAAISAMNGFQPWQFNPVNALYLSAAAAFWIGLDDKTGYRAMSLAPGIHVLTEQDPDDTASAKTTGLLHAALNAAQSANDARALVDGFRVLLQSHDQMGGGPESAACIHEERFGTVSSATVVVDRQGVVFEHAEGHPCVTPFLPVLG